MTTLSLILSLLYGSEFHEFKIGRFELRPEAESISLYIRLDRYNILEAIRPDCSDYNQLDKCFEEYINTHFSLTFNGTKVSAKHREHEFKDEFIELYFDLDISPEGITKIDVYNSTLLELNEGQENILYSMLNDKRRSFRMNKDRTRTMIVY
ncbi:DUF6702 family protein [Ekhidna sp. To15]|uniref:DUF6702 family protein n=1 Tax=Ekhidna sp. To15 TaxID=3395267 RepID=UPI003F52560E